MPGKEKWRIGLSMRWGLGTLRITSSYIIFSGWMLWKTDVNYHLVNTLFGLLVESQFGWITCALCDMCESFPWKRQDLNHHPSFLTSSYSFVAVSHRLRRTIRSPSCGLVELQRFIAGVMRRRVGYSWACGFCLRKDAEKSEAWIEYDPNLTGTTFELNMCWNLTQRTDV